MQRLDSSYLLFKVHLVIRFYLLLTMLLSFSWGNLLQLFSTSHLQLKWPLFAFSLFPFCLKIIPCKSLTFFLCQEDAGWTISWWPWVEQLLPFTDNISYVSEEYSFWQFYPFWKRKEKEEEEKKRKMLFIFQSIASSRDEEDSTKGTSSSSTLRWAI